MKNFTKAHLEAVVNYAMQNYEAITPELKTAVEEVSEFLGEPKEFFTKKQIENGLSTNQQMLECLLRFTALDDERAFERLCELNKDNAKHAKFAVPESQIPYESDDFYSFLFERVASLRWIDSLKKNLAISTILARHVAFEFREAQRIIEAGSHSTFNVDDFKKLLNMYDGDLFRVIEMSFEEYKSIFPRRGKKAYEDVMDLAQKRRYISCDELLEKYELDESKAQIFADNRDTDNGLREGIQNTFQNAVQYTQTIIEKAEKLGDRVYADKFRSVNLGYQMLIDLHLNEMTEAEITAYYSKCKEFSKLWAAHSYNYFIKKSLEDFKEHWEFYTAGDAEVQSYVQYLIKAMEAA